MVHKFPVDFDTNAPTPPNGPVPLFPLGGVFLYPHQVLPLHIFEQRYRDMVADLLDGPGRLVIASPQLGEREEPDRAPGVVPVGGLGEILRHEKLQDGRYMIWVLGLARVHIEEVASPHLYRQVECLPFLETPVPDEDRQQLADELREAAAGNSSGSFRRALVERAFSEPDVAPRARLALTAAAAEPPPADDDPTEDAPRGPDAE